MGYTHKHWAERRHRYSKHTNLQNHIDISQKNFDAQCPERRLSNWEQFELRDYCHDNGLEYPPIEDRTLITFRRLVGRDPSPV